MSKSSEALRSLNPVGLHEIGKQNLILVVEKDEAVRRAVGYLLNSLFPGLPLHMSRDYNGLPERIRGDLRGRLTMMVVDMGEQGEGLNLLKTLGDESCDLGLEKVPRVLTLHADEKNGYHDLADGVVQKPINPKTFEAVVEQSINSRANLFQAMEKESRASSLSKFIEIHKSLASIWLKDVRLLSFYGESGSAEPREDDFQKEVVGFIENGASETLAILEQLNSLGSDVKDEDLCRIVHDLNNKLTPLITGVPMALDPAFGLEVNDKDRAILTRMENEAHQTNRWTMSISLAYNGRGTWSEIATGNLVAQLREPLEFPRGSTFCVIDDDPDIRKVTDLNIKSVRGGEAKVYTVGDEMGLLNLARGMEDKVVNVFLLDHDLGGGKFGHELIPLIRALFPKTLIIAHTGDAIALNEDAENPYKKLGVEVVAKRAWGAVSGVIRRKTAGVGAENEA